MSLESGSFDPISNAERDVRQAVARCVETTPAITRTALVRNPAVCTEDCWRDVHRSVVRLASALAIVANLDVDAATDRVNAIVRSAAPETDDSSGLANAVASWCIEGVHLARTRRDPGGGVP